MPIRLIIALVLALGAADPAIGQRVPRAKLREIVDYDLNRRVVLRRADVDVDAAGRRVSNNVFDAAGKLIATERFHHDQQGRLSLREYRLVDGALKWKWTNFRHDARGNTVHCDIVNSRGRKLGWYAWRYDGQGRLARRDRFHRDGSLRFYYADMTYDGQGNEDRWVKYDGGSNRIGAKQWRYLSEEKN